MQEEELPTNAFSLASEMLQGAAQVIQHEGEPGAFYQIFLHRPDDESSEPEIGRATLDAMAGRALLQHRVASGFHGILGFSCLDKRVPRIYVEVFDTRPHVTRKSIALAGGLKRTLFGSYRPDGGLMDILGHPALFNDR